MPTVLSDKQKFVTRSPDGLKIGPVSRRVIVDLIRDRKVTSKHTFSADGGEFRPVTEDKEFYQHLSKYETLPPMQAYPDNAISIPPFSAPPPAPTPAAAHVSAPPAPAVAISDQARSDLDAMEDDDDDDDSDFSISLHELKDTVMALSKSRQNAGGEVMETLDEIELVEAGSDDDVIAIGDDSATDVEETFEEVEVMELEDAGSGPKRQVAKVPTSGRARLKAELLNPENRYVIRNADGLMLGPVRIATVKDLIEHGAIDRRALIQKNEERFADAWSIPEIRFLIVRLSQKK